MRITRELYDQIVGHALEDPDVECCGLVAVRGDEAVSAHRCVNEDLFDDVGGGLGGTLSFKVHPFQVIDLFEQFERDGLELGAIYHSHPHISPVPSGIDIRYAKNWPGVLWIIVGTGWMRPPDVWTWRIEDGRVHPAELRVEVGR